MLKKIFITLLVVAASVNLISANALLDLELTQGVSSAIPIAVVAFANDANNLAPGNQAVSQIISNDLNNSGQFRVQNPGMLAQAPTEASQVDFNYWRKQNVNDLVIGQVTPVGNNKYKVSFKLLGLFNQSDAKDFSADNATLLSMTFSGSKQSLRVIAHQISNQIYQKLTGIPGVFNTKIAYVLVNRTPGLPGRPIASRYSLEVTDADGFNPQTLLKSSEPIMSPTWLPNGKDIAYVSFEQHTPTIYLQNVFTGQRQLVSRFPGINGAPAFSPDGKTMALVLTLTDNPKLYLLNLQNKNLTRITDGYSIDTEPAFAPDGKSLIFTSNRGGTPQIYKYDLADKQITRLTFDGNYNARGSYLPDEKGIIMMHRHSDMFSIARQNLQSGQLDELTRTGYDESPSLSPNGQMIIYATQSGGRGVLAMVSINGRIKLLLPARDGSVQEPAWSPFLLSQGEKQ